MTTYKRRPYAAGGDIDVLDDAAPRLRRALDDRLGTLATTLGETAPASRAEAVEVVGDMVGSAPDHLWLAYAVLAGELPTDDDMTDLMVRARLGGAWAALAPAVDVLARAHRPRRVEVLRGAVTCDVTATAASDFVSGIQRVVRETTARWDRDHELTCVAWLRDSSGFRYLADDEHARLLRTTRSAPPVGVPSLVVPWECTHLWPEVVTHLARSARLLAMAQHSRNAVGVLGYDSIPITSSATVSEGMTSHFARSLAGQRRADRVALISHAAAEEYRGVVSMGAGRRDRGPRVAAVDLPVAAPHSTDDDLEEARTHLTMGDVPMVLVVGSHEPRKNHLAVLHAAERLWREGVSFNLVMVGAGSWNATEYDATLVSMIRSGRPVQSIRGLPDRLLWATYRLAHCTLFPSLNEGFGLPVAESLAAGTPVVTSDFGSMREIAAPRGTPWGALLVDPRDDDSILGALRAMLTDAGLHGRLREETQLHPARSWDEYATELWDFLVDGAEPVASPAPTAVVDGTPEMRSS